MDDAAVEHWIDAIGLPALEQVRDRQPESLTADVRRQAARDVILTVREAGAPANPDGTRPTVFNLRLVAAIVLAEAQVWLADGPRSWGASCRGVIRNASRSQAPQSTRWPQTSPRSGWHPWVIPMTDP
jgi:hypothetical protein